MRAQFGRGQGALEPLQLKKARSTPRDDAATSPPRLCERLELEYASSLIRVIRSRKDADSRTRESPLVSVERPVQAADNVILLSGCERFSLSSRRRGTETLVQLAHVDGGQNFAKESGGSCGSAESEIGRHRSAGKLHDSTTQVRRALDTESHQLCIPEKMLYSPRRQELSVLSKSRNNALKNEGDSEQPCLTKVGLARWGWRNPAPVAFKSLACDKNHANDAGVMSHEMAEVAAGPGISEYAEGSTMSTIQICRNCNDWFEDSFAQGRIEQCTALMQCARKLLENTPLGCGVEMAQLASRTWTNIGLLQSHNKEIQSAVESFGKAFALQRGTRDVAAVASAQANLSLALVDAGLLGPALAHSQSCLDSCLDVLGLGPVHTLSDEDIPEESDAQQLLKIMATSLLVEGSVHETQGHECLTAYRGAMLIARHLVAGSESLADKIHQKYTSMLQKELTRACSTEDETMFHSKFFNTKQDIKNIPSTKIQHELAAGRTGKTSRRFMVGTAVEFEGAEKIQDLRNGLPLQSRHLRNLALACTLTLQCAYRCRRARKSLAAQLQLRPFNMHDVLKIQRVFRAHLDRRCFRRIKQGREASSALFLKACMQRRLQHSALLGRLAIHADVRMCAFSISQTVYFPSSGPVAVARSLVTAVGLRSFSQQTVFHCMAVLQELGYNEYDIDTLCILLNRDATATINSEHFFKAVLPVILLSAEAGDAEDVREACTIFDLVQKQQPPNNSESAGVVKRLACTTILLSLGYSDDEVDAVITLLENDDAACQPSTINGNIEHVGKDAWVTREAFVGAMCCILLNARKVRDAELVRRRFECDMATHEPNHPLLCIQRKKASVKLQCAWRAKVARARICKQMGRSYSGTRHEILVFLGMRQEVEVQDAHRNKIAVDVQCAFRSFLARKSIMRERLARPMRLIRQLRWHQEQAATRLQKWILLCHSTRFLRESKAMRACFTLQCTIRMCQARRKVEKIRRHAAATRIQFFWRIQVVLRSIPWWRRRCNASLRLQTQVRRWLARIRLDEARDAANLREVQLWRAQCSAVCMIRPAFAAYRARRHLKHLALMRHVETQVAQLLSPVILGHRGRQVAAAHKYLRQLKIQTDRALQVQCAFRQRISRRRLILRRRDEVAQHRAAFTLGAALRCHLGRHRYERLRSGDLSAECLQGVWRGHLARKAAAAFQLLPFLRRSAAARVAPFFLVRVAERKAGLTPGSICLHCLILVAGGHTRLPCTSLVGNLFEGPTGSQKKAQASHAPVGYLVSHGNSQSTASAIADVMPCSGADDSHVKAPKLSHLESIASSNALVKVTRSPGGSADQPMRNQSGSGQSSRHVQAEVAYSKHSASAGSMKSTQTTRRARLPPFLD